MTESPQRQVLIGREVWDLYADSRAWIAIEKTTKRSYRHWIRRLLKSEKNGKLEPLFLFLWGLSARHRFKQNVPIPMMSEDRAMGLPFPSEFLDRVSQKREDLEVLRRKVYELLEECGEITFEVKPEAISPGEEGQNPTMIPDPSTGTGDL